MLRELPSVTHHPRPAESAPAGDAELAPLKALDDPRPLRILDFDSECRPDAYLGGDLTTRSLTGIAAQFVGHDVMWCECIVAGGHRHYEQLRAMLEGFRALYDAADIVTGHNIVRHDLPIISGSMIYCGLPPLDPKLASDTLLHGPKSGLVFSRSQENLGDMFAILSDKYHMNNARWKRANTLDPEHADETRRRVTDDVRMHLDLRAAMIENDLLGPAKLWHPGGRRIPPKRGITSVGTAS